MCADHEHVSLHAADAQQGRSAGRASDGGDDRSTTGAVPANITATQTHRLTAAIGQQWRRHLFDARSRVGLRV